MNAHQRLKEQAMANTAKRGTECRRPAFVIADHDAPGEIRSMRFSCSKGGAGSPP